MTRSFAALGLTRSRTATITAAGDGRGTIASALQPIRVVRRRRTAAARGFTLLEVLLVAVLSVFLLAGIWSLYGVYVRLIEKGQSRTEQAQLVRSLIRQVSDDLKSAIQDTASRPPGQPATTPLRRFGLFGTAQSLQIDIMHAAPREEDFLPKESLSSPWSDEPVGPRAPEFRTVIYEFVEPPMISDEEGLPAVPDETSPTQSGLTRRELDWEIPGDVQLAGIEPRLTGSSLTHVTTNAASPEAAPADTSAQVPPVDNQVLCVPEVVSLDFRYFDGKGWASQWNSIERKSLPAAIEVRVKIKPPQPLKRQPPKDVQPSEEETAADREEDIRITVHDAAATGTIHQEPVLPTHRIVISLPVSSLQGPPKAVGASGGQFQPAPAGVTVPPITVQPITIPPVSVSAPPVRRPPGDQHIRNQ